MSLVHPLARVRGSGSAKSGVEHWWLQRLTAVALVPLTLWVVYSLAKLEGAGHGAVMAWLQGPVNAALLLSWVVAMLYHAQLGLQVVIEDYVHGAMEWVAHVAVKFIAILAAVIATLSILRIVV